MKAKLKNGMEVEGTPEEFRRFFGGEPTTTIHVKRGKYRKRRHHSRRKSSVRTLQRRMPPEYAQHRSWSGQDDQFILDNYPAGGNTSKGAKGYIKQIERMCHTLRRTPRAVQQRKFHLQALERARKE